MSASSTHRRRVPLPQSTGIAAAAERAAIWIGSAIFLVGFNLITLLYAFINTAGFTQGFHFDAYPFTFYVLLISVLAIDMSSLILMSQAREAERDRLEAHADYVHNLECLYWSRAGYIAARVLAEHLTCLSELDAAVADSLGDPPPGLTVSDAPQG